MHNVHKHLRWRARICMQFIRICNFDLISSQTHIQIPYIVWAHSQDWVNYPESICLYLSFDSDIMKSTTHLVSRMIYTHMGLNIWYERECEVCGMKLGKGVESEKKRKNADYVEQIYHSSGTAIGTQDRSSNLSGGWRSISDEMDPYFRFFSWDSFVPRVLFLQQPLFSNALEFHISYFLIYLSNFVFITSWIRKIDRLRTIGVMYHDIFRRLCVLFMKLWARR